MDTSMRRRILTQAVVNILSECGFESCDKAALETLTEMLQSLLYEIGQSSKNYCELSGRTEILIADVILALVNCGIRIDNIESHAKRPNRTILPTLQHQTQTKQFNILQAGIKQNHAPHIPDYLPPFPDPHAYIRTPTHKQPVTEYEFVREKAAQQKRDLERALTRFKAKTGQTRSLFYKDDDSKDDKNKDAKIKEEKSKDDMFPLIVCSPQFPSYLSALLPQDQVFDSDSDLETSPSKKKKEKDKEAKDGKNGGDEENGTEPNGESKTEVIDNPYLRPGKPPKIKITPLSKHPENGTLSFLS